MNPGDKVKLAVDVISNSKGKLYGKRGSEVTIIADHENVLIVTDAKGLRFPVHISKIDNG
jgi:hypothetical protein